MIQKPKGILLHKLRSGARQGIVELGKKKILNRLVNSLGRVFLSIKKGAAENIFSPL